METGKESVSDSVGIHVYVALGKPFMSNYRYERQLTTHRTHVIA